MPTVDLRDITVLEPTSSSALARFTLFLDAPATAPTTVFYYLQGATATESTGDFDQFSGSVTFQVGESTRVIETQINSDDRIEGNETFQLVVTAGTNAMLAGGAAALRATATILDTDDQLPDPPPGTGDLAERIAGPAAQPGLFPTLDVQGVGVIEGNSSSDPARFLVMLDRPATAPVTFRYYFQSVTASEAQEDFDDFSHSATIAAGQQSIWIETTVAGDIAPEGNETFQIVLTDIQNGVFAGGAEALTATGTIIDDDSGAPMGPFGQGGASVPIQGPAAQSPVLPTLSVRDVSVIEGNSSSDPVRFLITLDRPSPVPVTFFYSLNGGSASEASGDFDQFANTITLPAGTESTWIETTVNGDIAIEGNETFTLVLSGIRNAVFENGAAALSATATILDDDAGPLTGPAGIGAPADGVAPPLPGPGGGTAVTVVDTSLTEGNSSSDVAYVHLVLSQPATAAITMTYAVLSGSATAEDDFDGFTTSLTIAAGVQSTWISVPVFGDTEIETDENFIVRFSNLSGGTFANGQSSMDATVLIRDDDGLGSAGSPDTGPQFDFIINTPGATEGNDTLIGGTGNDMINARGGNDLVQGLGGNDRLQGQGGNDRLDGGTGRDTMEGGLGNDIYFVDDAGDVIQGEVAFGAGGGIDTVFTTVNFTAPANIELVRAAAGAGNLTLTGNDAPGTLVGNEGANRLEGRGGNDQINGNAGNDTLVGGEGADTLVGGTGADTFVFSAVSNSRTGAANRDVINGFTRAPADQDRIDLSAIDANTLTAGVNDAFTFIGNAAFSATGSAGQLRIQGLGGANALILEADVNGDRIADMQIFVNLTTAMALGDFVL
jgi:Ca2+-binding RTX toxin-like protein